MKGERLLYSDTTFRPKYDYSKLRGKIREVFGTEENFAAAIGRHRNFLTKVFGFKSYFEQRDIDKACEVLSIPTNEIDRYFFTLQVCENET